MKTLSGLCFVSLIVGMAVAAMPPNASAAPRQVAHEVGLQLADGSNAVVQRLMSDTPRNKPAMAALLARDARWRGIFDEVTDVPSRLWGGSEYVAGANATPAVAEAAARSFIAAHLDLLAPGSTMNDLVLVTNVQEQGIRSVAFEQYAGGMRVIGGQLSVSFKNDCLFLVRSQALPHVTTAVTSAPRASQGAAALQAAAASWVASVYGSRVVAGVPSSPMILPVLRRGAPVQYQIVNVIDVNGYAPRGRWDVYVDTATTKPVARHQRLHFGSGTVHYNAPARYPGGDRLSYTVPFAIHMVNNTTVEADANGQLQWVGDDNAQVVPGLTSRYSRVVNDAGTEASIEATLVNGGFFEWIDSMHERIDAQISAFVHVNIAKRYALALDAELPWLSEKIDTFVNGTNGTCNAYSDLDDIHFFVKDDECENTARLADVIYHEFSHSFHYQAKLQGIGDDDGSLSEGTSDYYAATITNDPGMGRGFFFTSSALRHIDPPNSEAVWPEDISDDNHETGQIIAGALWDLRKAAIETMGEAEGIRFADNAYLAIIRRASDLPSAYTEVLAFDDDDGNLGNGTPNFCMIFTAFSLHGLAGGASLFDITTPSFDGTTVSLTATAKEIENCTVPTVDSITADWKIRGSDDAGSVNLVANGNDYTAQLPQQADGTVVRYRLRVTLSNGSRISLPRNPADNYYEYYVGPVETIYCTDFETDPQWQANATGANNIWAVGTPSPDAADGEATSAVSGENIYALGLNKPYRNDAIYTSQVPTIEIDTTTFKSVRLQYQRWLEVEDGLFDLATVKVGNTTVWNNKKGVGESSHIDGEWRFHDIDITNVMRQQAEEQGNETAFPLQVTFGLKSDEGLQFAGWAMDDFCVVGVPGKPECTGDACETVSEKTGCCSANHGFASPLLLALGALGLLVRRRRG